MTGEPGTALRARTEANDAGEALAEQAARQALNVAVFGGAKAVAEAIRPEWLTHSRQLILKAALAAEAEGWVPDGAAIRSWLEGRGDVSAMTAREYSLILEMPGSIKNLALYARILERSWRERRSAHLAVAIAGEPDPARRAELGMELASTSQPARIEAGAENSDAGNADRLIEAAAGRLRHCPDLGEGEKGWLWWNGNHWVRRAREQAYALLTESTRERLKNVHAEDKAGVRFVHGSLAESKLRAAIRLAEMRPGVTIRGVELDSDPWILTCGNGTLDLRSGDLTEPRARDYITRAIAVDLDLGAERPTWTRFLETSMGGRARLVEYLQLAVGYSLTGITREQVFFLLYGTGANGKSTFIETVTSLMGEYAYAAPFETFAMTHNRQSERDMFPLRAARFVSSVEAESGQRLAESFIKRATGGDTVTGRALFAETINFAPQFKLWLAANHLPEIRGTDEAIWRRVRLIPFEVTIPEAERDPELKDKLREELPGILAWAVKGCYAWAKIGMPKVAEVTAATAHYREDQDWIGEFLGDVCTLGPGLECSSTVLYSAFKKWAESRGTNRPPSHRKLSMILKDRGLRNYRSGIGMQWRGIACM
jgi:putative DNA primase/helicase